MEAKVGELIESQRKLAGLTQKDLADLAGVGKTLVFDLEHGKESIRFDMLLKVLKALNIKFELKVPSETIS